MRAFKKTLTVLFVLAVAFGAAGYAMIANLDLERLRALARDLAQEVTGRDLIVAGPIDLKLSLRPRITLDDVSFLNAPWGSRPEMMRIKRFELEVALLPLIMGDIVVERLVMIEPDILLESDRTGRVNWKFDAAEKETAIGSGLASEDVFFPNVRIFVLHNGRVAFRNGESGVERRVRLDRAAGETRGLGEPLLFSLHGAFADVPLELQGSLGALSAFGVEEDLPITVKGNFSNAELSLDGRFLMRKATPMLDVNVSLAGSNLSELAASLKQDIALPQPYRASGRISGGGGRYRLSGLDLILGTSDISGVLDIETDAPRPRIAGSLVSRALNLADLIEESGKGGESGQGASPYLFEDKKLPLKLLGAVDAKLDISAGSVELPAGQKLEGLKTDISLNAGRLKIASLTTTLAQGEIKARLLLDSASDPAKLEVAVDGRQLDYGRIAHAGQTDEGLSGLLDLKLELEGWGNTPRRLAAGLDGRVALSSREGTIDSKVFGQWVAGLDSVIGPLLEAERSARLNCLLFAFDFERGLGHSRSLLLDSESVTLQGDGTLDLRDERLALDFHTTTRSPGLAGLAMPFKLRGTLKAPEVLSKAPGSGSSDLPPELSDADDGEGPALCGTALREGRLTPASPSSAGIGRGGEDFAFLKGAFQNFERDLGKVDGHVD